MKIFDFADNDKIEYVQGQVCPNEAEFCAYDILLHLTDGDVLK